MNVTVDALVQLRVGGLPVGTEQALSTPAALEWADLVLNGRREVTRRRREASDRLASLIEGASRQWRKELVQIRRAVFNGRPTARGVAALPAGLAAEARAAVLPAEQAGGRLTALVDRGRQEFDGWLVSQRQGLASLLDDQDFKDGLAVAAPMAMRDLMRYPQHGVCPRPSKSMRKAERSLVSYASRAIAKTSPFSTFTPTALATFKGTGPSWSLLPVRPTRRTRWNVYPVARALGALAEDRSWLHDLPLRLARTIAVLPDGSLLVARSVYEFKDSHRAEDYATCEQSTVRLRHVGLVRAVEALLVDGPRPFAEVVQGVAGTTALAEERAEDAVLGLVRLGVLEVDGLDLHPHTAAWAGRSRDVLIRTNDTRASQLVTMLDDYEGAARRIAGLEGDARLQGLQELPAKVAAIYRTASLEASLPRTVVYEDCALDAGPYTGPALRWSEEECRALVRLACLLDTAQTDRALMRGYFTETVGEGRRCDDVAGFLRSFNSDLYDAYKSRPGDPDTPAAAEGANDPWLRWGEAWRWVAARQELSALVEGAQKETDLLPLLRPGSAVTDGLRFPRQRYQHLFLFAQLLPEGDVGSMVVNRVFGQAGFGLSRFSYLHGEQGARVARDQEARAREHGVVLAEISGGTTFTNLNLHGPLLDTEIVLPGDPSGSQTARRLALEELALEDRPEEGRLVLLDQDGREVQPAYLGYLVLAATPWLTQLVSLLAPPGNIGTSLVPRLPEGEDVRVLPRLRLGSLVLRRHTTQVGHDLLPDADPATAEGYLAWVEWWRSLDLPEQCYVTVADDSPQGGGKPRFVDVTSVISLLTACHEWRGAEGALHVAESLPSLDQTLINRADGDRRIHELVLGFDVTQPDQEEIRS